MARSYKTTFIIDGDSSGAVQAQRNVRNESQALTRELENAERQNEELSASFESVSRRATQLTTFLGATAAAAGTLATRQTLAITEQQNLARSLDVSVQTLQEWQFAANQVGINSEKMGDIFKDTSDKLGDFVATGGGEAADLFEKLNLNVDKLQGKGPAEQLLAIGKALKDVGSQDQKVFFLESIADDASRLLPLLENNGELLKENAELARQLGISIPQEDVDSIKDAGDALKELQGVGTGFANEIATQAAPAIRDLTDGVRSAIDVIGGMDNAVDTMEAGVATLATVLSARLAGSLATATAATTRKIATDLAAAQQAKATEAAEAGHAAALARTAAAEKTATANSAALAAQRAASARQEAAAEAQRIQSLQASLAAERALEAQRLQAQITSKGRQQSINRMAELRRTEVATTNQATAANTRLAEAETAEAAAARQARLAKVEQTQASTAATAASARYTAATRAATTANRALAVSGRALSGAMGLLGGPAGVAILAAGALYTFREELGLVKAEAETTQDRIAGLTSSLAVMGQSAVDSSIESTKAELQFLEAQAWNTQQAINQLDKGETFDGRTKSQLEAQLESIADDVAFARQELDKLKRRRDELNDSSNSDNEFASDIREIGDANDDAATAAEKFDDSLLSLLDRIDPLAKSQREFTRDNAALQTALLSGRITTEEYFESIGQLEQSYRNAGDAAEVYGLTGERANQRVEESVDPMVTTFERGLERMDDAGVDMWRGFLDGTTSAMDSLEDIVLDTVAEIAHNLTTRQLIVPIQAAITGDGQQGASQAGGGAGSMQMPSTTNLGSAWNTAQNAYAGYTGTYGASLGAQGGVSGQAIGSANAVANGTGAQGAWNAAAGGAGGAAGGTSLGLTNYGSGGGYAGGLANMGAGMAAAYAGGYVGDQVSGAVSDKQANSSYGQTAGAAIGSIWGPLGTAAGAAIGSVVDTVFGSSPQELDLAMVRGENESSHNWDHGITATGALGSVGFQDEGSHDLLDVWDKEGAQKLIDGIAQLDNMLGALAETPEELQSMQDSVLASNRHGIEGHYGETSNPGDVVGRLTSRYKDAIDVLDLATEDFLLSFEGKAQDLVSITSNLSNFEDLVGDNASAMAAMRNAIADSDDVVATSQELVQQAQAMNALSGVTETLNLKFDATRANALEAAGSLSEMAGGLQNLSSLQQNYADTMLTEEQQYQQMQKSMEKAFESLGIAVPKSREQFRTLVEAQNLNTEAGRENYVQLMQLVDSFDRLRESASSVNDDTSALDDRLSALNDKIGGLKDDVKSAYEAFADQSFDQRVTLLEMAGKSEEALAIQREQQLESMDPLLRETQEHIWALQDEKEAQQEAAQAGQEYARALASAQDSLGSTFNSISSYLDQLRSTDQGGGTPREQLVAARSAFNEQLQAARSGDRTALQNITQYADRLIDAQRGWSASGGATASIIERVENQLSNLPDQVSAEQFITDEIKAALIEQTAGITSQLADVLRSDTPSNIAQQLAGSFDDLTRGIGDVLTREQLAIVMDGKATDAQLEAVMRAVDLNGDGVMSGLESVIIKSMPTDATLTNVLRNQLERSRNQSLSVDEVRQALSPIASDERINQLIGRVDVNGDGLLSAQEITSARIGGLSSGIAQSLSGYFDELDANLDGNLTFEELSKGLDGLATDSQLRAMMQSMDLNSDGVISGLESVIISEMPNDARLTNVLRNQMERSRNQSLSYAEVREALSPIASKAVINRLINKADRNADGVITAQELNSLRIGELTDSVISTLDASFDQLDANLDGKLTFAELRDGLDGMATNSQLRAMMRASDINANGVISGLEAVVIKSMPTDARLTNVLRNQLERSRNQSLSYSEVREALNPIASKTVINRLINRADVNADGIITAQELANARLDGLAEGIGGALSPMFDSIDNNLDGLINYEEFGKQFAGLASDQQLKNIFETLDKNGDGTISELEAMNKSTDEVGENTKSIEERSLEQLTELNSLVSEMSRTTDQFVGLNSNMVGLRESINLLVDAREEVARIEREQKASELRELGSTEKDRIQSTIASRRSSIVGEIRDLQSERRGLSDRMTTDADSSVIGNYPDRDSAISNIDSVLQGHIDRLGVTGKTAAEFKQYFTEGPGFYSDQGIGDAPGPGGAYSPGGAYWPYVVEQIKALQASAQDNRSDRSELSKSINDLQDEFKGVGGSVDRSRLADLRKQYRELMGEPAPFAKGGVFTNSIVGQPTQFDMGLMGEAGPEAIMPLTRHTDGGLGIRAELPPIPALPLLGQGDIVETLQDLRREVAGLRADNKRLLGESNDHAAAGVRVNQAGFQQQIGATERGNKSLKKLQERERMGELAR